MKKSGLVFALWLVGTSVALFVWGFSSYGYFDQDNRWLGNTMPVTLPVSTLTHVPQKQWLLVHIRAEGCRCNRLADAHIETFDTDFAGQLIHVFMTVAEAEQAGLVVPATPMVVLFDTKSVKAEAHLQYAGPYASGPLCSVDNSVLPSLLNETIKPAGAWFNGNIKACRCVT